MHARVDTAESPSSSLWQWWVAVPLLAAAISAWLGSRAIIGADRYLDSLTPTSIDGLNRGVAGIQHLSGLVGLACAAGCAVVAWQFLNRLAFDRPARSMVWGSAAYLAGFFPWLGDLFASKQDVGAVSTGQHRLDIWAVGALFLCVGTFWSTESGFRRPRRPRWWHATWLPWLPSFIAFTTTTAVLAWT